MTNYAVGHLAEECAARYLKRMGYEVVDINWKTRSCEIDIVAMQRKRVYFIEVKYRKTNNQGSGLEYITAKKLDQMNFAARLWLSQNDWDGDYCLGAIEVSGQDFEITNFLTDL